MAKKTVKLLRSRGYLDGTTSKQGMRGQTVSLDEFQARVFIADGSAEEVKASKPKAAKKTK